MECSRKTVSVIIPVFNGQSTIAAAIDSALAQEFDGEVEVIVVNDGSTDATAAVLKSYRGRMKVLERKNGGPAAARNQGVRASHGEYIAFLDADDIWLPRKLATTIAALERDRGAAMVYTNAWNIDANGRRPGTTYTPLRQRRAPTMDDLLSRLWNILPSTAVMTRATFERIGGFCEQFATGHPQWEDSYFMLIAREQGDFIYLDEPTAMYRAAASVAEDLTRRRVWGQADASAESLRVERYVTNSELIERLVRKRYGNRARRLVAAIHKATEDLMVSVGLTAMVEGERGFARRAYLHALRYGPLNPRTYFRVGWTCLPESAARAIATFLPDRLQRAVCGPAFK